MDGEKMLKEILNSDRNTEKARETKEAEGKNILIEFEYIKDLAELKALSNLSLEKPLNEEEYKRMIELAKRLNIVGGEWTI